MLINKSKVEPTGKVKWKMPFKHEGQFGAWRLINLIVSGILLTFTLFGFYFSFQKINESLSDTGTIAILTASVRFEPLDLKAYDVAKQTIEAKKDLEPIEQDLRNIFAYREGGPDNVTSTPEIITNNVTSTPVEN